MGNVYLLKRTNFRIILLFWAFEKDFLIIKYFPYRVNTDIYDPCKTQINFQSFLVRLIYDDVVEDHIHAMFHVFLVFPYYKVISVIMKFENLYLFQ